MKTKELKKIKIRRLARVRVKVQGDAARPRLTVFRSNRFLYAQLIDDASGKTLASASTAALAKEQKGKKIDSARAAGEALAKKAVELGIKEAVFDRGSYRYHGRVRAIAEGARSAGLKF
jgi:large subunit ribosomal protein L18